MRSNRPNYTMTPAGSSRALEKKPKQKRPKKEINQMMLVVFFAVLPILALLSIFFQPIRFVFLLCAILAIAFMWLLRCYKFPGRMILTALYGFLSVLILIAALSHQQQQQSTVIRQQTLLVTPEPEPEVTTTPAFENMYYTMGTSVPADYYVTIESDDELGDLNEVEVSNGLDESVDSTGIAEDGEIAAYVPTVKSEAEIALENFMEKWYKKIMADMVEYTAPSWRQASEEQDPEYRLFWKFQSKTLVDWRQMSAPTGTDASTARTIAIQADVEYNGEVRTYEYDAITLNEGGNWYVDPDSLSAGQLVVKATATPDPNMTPTPSPEPTPTPTPGPKTKLYYNKDGGKKYHIDDRCPSVASKYLPLKGTFTYSELSKSPYNKLEPCDRCGAPPKP